MDNNDNEENKIDPEVLDKILGDGNKCNWRVEILDNNLEERRRSISRSISKSLKIFLIVCMAVIGVLFIWLISYKVYRHVTGMMLENRGESSENINESNTEYKEDTEVVMSLKETGSSITIRYEDSSFGSTTWQRISRPLYYDESTMLMYIKNDSFSSLIPYMKDVNTQYMWDINKHELY